MRDDKVADGHSPAEIASKIVDAELRAATRGVELRRSPLDNKPFLSPGASQRQVDAWNMRLARAGHTDRVVVQPTVGGMAVLPRPRR